VVVVAVASAAVEAVASKAKRLASTNMLYMTVTRAH
jgi:hypothetical protein